MAKFINPTKVITGVNTRWSYVNAWEPNSRACTWKYRFQQSTWS